MSVSKDDVLKSGVTEPPFSGKLLKNKDSGMYVCGDCGNPLFDSVTKFDSGSGWPSFYDVVGSVAVDLMIDESHGMVRTEILCKKCGGHLGHVFDDGYGQPTGKRYCVSSLALDFMGSDGTKKEG